MPADIKDMGGWIRESFAGAQKLHRQVFLSLLSSVPVHGRKEEKNVNARKGRKEGPTTNQTCAHELKDFAAHFP